MDNMEILSSSTTTGTQELHHCLICDKLTTEKCTVCGNVYYCGLEHEAEDRLRHQFECQRPWDSIKDQWVANDAPTDESTSRSGIRPTQIPLLVSLPESRTESLSEDVSLVRQPFEKSFSKTKKKKKKSKKKKPEKFEVKAFHFASSSEEDPEIIPVQYSNVHGSFEDDFHRVHYHRIVKEDAEFNTIPTYRGLFLVIRSSDSTAKNFNLESNQCLFNFTNGLGLVWHGNVLVLKESITDSSMFIDVEPADLSILRTFFKLDGQAPLGTLTRHLNLTKDPSTPLPPPPVPGFPFPQPRVSPTTNAPKKLTVDVLVFPATFTVPYLTPLPCSPYTGRPHRADFESILGPDFIFNQVVTYAGTFMVGCRPRFGYEGERLWNTDDDDPGAEDVNDAVKCITRQQGGWKKWPRVNIIALKLKTEFEILGEIESESKTSKTTTPSTPGGFGDTSRIPKDATIFDVAPLVRYFQLSGMMPESALLAALSRP